MLIFASFQLTKYLTLTRAYTRRCDGKSESACLAHALLGLQYQKGEWGLHVRDLSEPTGCGYMINYARKAEFVGIELGSTH